MRHVRFTAERRDVTGDFEAITEYQDRAGGVAMVTELRAGLEEITPSEYEAELAAIRTHNAAIAPPTPPARKTRAELRAAVEAATTLPQLRAAVLELLGG